MPEVHSIWVQYTQSEENDLNNTFQGRIPSFPVSYFRRTPPNQILQFWECLPASKSVSTYSKRCKNTQHWVLRPQAQEYGVVIQAKFKDHHGSADCVDWVIRVVKQMYKLHIVLVGSIVGPTHLVRENEASDGIDSEWLLHNDVDLNTYWTVY